MKELCQHHSSPIPPITWENIHIGAKGPWAADDPNYSVPPATSACLAFDQFQDGLWGEGQTPRVCIVAFHPFFHSKSIS